MLLWLFVQTTNLLFVLKHGRHVPRKWAASPQPADRIKAPVENWISFYMQMGRISATCTQDIASRNSCADSADSAFSPEMVQDGMVRPAFLHVPGAKMTVVYTNSLKRNVFEVCVDNLRNCSTVCWRATFLHMCWKVHVDDLRYGCTRFWRIATERTIFERPVDALRYLHTGGHRATAARFLVPRHNQITNTYNICVSEP
jgi:hypothetical protein